MKKLLILCMTILFSFSISQAQILRKQKERAQERAEQRTEQKAQNKVDQKVDETVDKAFEAVGNIFKKKNKNEDETTDDAEQSEMQGRMPQGFPADLESMFQAKSAADAGLPNQYVFKRQMHGVIHSYNKKGKEESMPFTYLFPEDGKCFGYEMSEQGAIAITDMDINKMVSIAAKENIATVMDINAMMETAATYMEDNESEQEDSEADMPTLEKTGKTKTIAGYTCEQYLFDNEDANGELWMAPDIQEYSFMNMGMKMQEMQNKKNKRDKMPAEYAALMQNGFVMESIMIDKADNSKVHYIVDEVSNTSKTIDLTKYQFMDMSAMMRNK